MTPAEYALTQVRGQFGNRKAMGPQDSNRARDYLARYPEEARQFQQQRQNQAVGGEQTNVGAALETQRARDLLNHLMQPAAQPQARQAPARAPSGGGKKAPGKNFPVDQPKKDMRSNRQAEMNGDERTRPFETAENPRTRLTPQEPDGGGPWPWVGIGGAGAVAAGAYLIYRALRNPRTGKTEQMPVVVDQKTGAQRPASAYEAANTPSWEDLQAAQQRRPRQLTAPMTIDNTGYDPRYDGQGQGGPPNSVRPDAVAAPSRQISGPAPAAEPPSATQAPDVIAGGQPEPTRNIYPETENAPRSEYDPDNPQGSTDINERNAQGTRFKKKSEYPDAIDRSMEEPETRQAAKAAVRKSARGIKRK